jgi:two-component system response regulator
MNLSTESYHLLVIEDDQSEQKLLKMMIKGSSYNCNVDFINDGEEAINFIRKFSLNDDKSNKIDLILLDLNLPKVRGVEVLQAFRQNQYFKKVPIVVLTTSNNSTDVTDAYETGASGYIRKPSVIEEYEEAIKILFNYWFSLCLIP